MSALFGTDALMAGVVVGRVGDAGRYAALFEWAGQIVRPIENVATQAPVRRPANATAYNILIVAMSWADAEGRAAWLDVPLADQ